MRAGTWKRSLAAAVLSLALLGAADEPKNHDFDIIRDEAKVPPYQLPLLLVSSEGKPISTPEQWFNVRRPQIMGLFGNLIYGVVPTPVLPLRTTFEVMRTNREFIGGQAIRKDVWIRFANNEDDLPVDQHMLLACIAPRSLYVAGAAEDFWADPRGEYLSAYHASEVYRLLGKKGLTDETSPPLGQALVDSDVGYHNRPGGHSVEMFDWLKFMEFAEYHLRPKNREAN